YHPGSAGFDPRIHLGGKRGGGGTKPGRDGAGRRNMGMTWRAALFSLLLFGLFVGVGHLATLGSGPAVTMDPEYAKLMGATATQGKSAMPGPLDVGAKLWEHLKRPFYDNGPNDK